MSILPVLTFAPHRLRPRLVPAFDAQPARRVEMHWLLAAGSLTLGFPWPNPCRLAGTSPEYTNRFTPLALVCMRMVILSP